MFIVLFVVCLFLGFVVRHQNHDIAMQPRTIAKIEYGNPRQIATELSILKMCFGSLLYLWLYQHIHEFVKMPMTPRIIGSISYFIFYFLVVIVRHHHDCGAPFSFTMTRPLGYSSFRLSSEPVLKITYFGFGCHGANTTVRPLALPNASISACLSSSAGSPRHPPDSTTSHNTRSFRRFISQPL